MKDCEKGKLITMQHFTSGMPPGEGKEREEIGIMQIVTVSL